MCECRSHNGFLTAKGLEETAQRLSLEGLAPRGVHGYLDKVVSVSGLVEVEDLYAHVTDQDLDEQARRVHNGC